MHVPKRKHTIIMQILFLNLFPHNRVSIVTGFSENCNLPVGWGKLGYSLGSLLPSPDFLFSASALGRISTEIIILAA
jgi:hypothetical protein